MHQKINKFYLMYPFSIYALTPRYHGVVAVTVTTLLGLSLNPGEVANTRYVPAWVGTNVGEFPVALKFIHKVPTCRSHSYIMVSPPLYVAVKVCPTTAGDGVTVTVPGRSGIVPEGKIVNVCTLDCTPSIVRRK